MSLGEATRLLSLKVWTDVRSWPVLIALERRIDSDGRARYVVACRRPALIAGFSEDFIEEEWVEEIPSGVAERAVAEFRNSSIAPAPSKWKQFLDGTRFELAVGGRPVRAVYEWHVETPEGWQPLETIAGYRQEWARTSEHRGYHPGTRMPPERRNSQVF